MRRWTGICNRFDRDWGNCERLLARLWMWCSGNGGTGNRSNLSRGESTVILPDWQIIELSERQTMIDPFARERVNPASVDLCVSDEIVDIASSRRVHCEDVIRINPGQHVLVSTVETVRLPDDVAGQLILKSSMGRRGVSMPAAGWVDPGFVGTLTVQISACAPVLLTPGQPFVQLVLHKLAAAPDSAYNGHYQGQQGVTGAWDDTDDTGPASLNEPANEHIIYLAPTEGLQLADWKEGAGL